MARRKQTPLRGSRIGAAVSLLALSLGLLVVALPAAGPQGAPEAFAAKKAAPKKATKKAAPKAKAVAKKDAAPAAAAPPPPKRPLSAYMLWLKEERPKIVKALGSSDVPAVGAEAGKRWNKLTKKAKAPFEEEAADLKEDYEEDLKEFIAEYGAEAAKRPKKKKAKKDPNAPKKPGNPYSLWVKDNYSKIKAKLPRDASPTDVIVEAGKDWKKVSAAVKGKYKKTADKAVAEYMKKKEAYEKTLVAA